MDNLRRSNSKRIVQIKQRQSDTLHLWPINLNLKTMVTQHTSTVLDHRLIIYFNRLKLCGDLHQESPNVSVVVGSGWITRFPLCSSTSAHPAKEMETKSTIPTLCKHQFC